jgi:hypothetical protein
MYAQAQAAGDAGEAAAGEGKAGGKEDVVEAEFEEVKDEKK